MKWSTFIVLQLLIILATGFVFYIHNDDISVSKMPPASLAKWYKPENERQEWLHNMFKLRREMQAVKLYSASNEAELLDKWSALLSEHYIKIAEMVPEWDKKLNMEALNYLQASVKASDQQGVTLALDDLNKTCESCHLDYRSTVATMYRAPDFSSIKLDQSFTYQEHMKVLIQLVNQIKIASEDGRRDVALSSLYKLKDGVELQGNTCVQCHEKDARTYPDDAMLQIVAELEQSLATGTQKEQGRALGTLAVEACARCHGTHRIAYDNRKVFVDGPNWRELIKH